MSSIHDRAIHSEARELCLALAKVCQSLHQWDGARTLQHAAEYLYREKYRALLEPSSRVERGVVLKEGGF